MFAARVSGTDGRASMTLRPNSWAAFLQFAMHTLRRNAQSGLVRIKAQDLLHGAKPAEVASYAQRTPALQGQLLNCASLPISVYWEMALACRAVSR
jgi:hypothetical protein